MQGVEERGMRRTFRYAAVTRDEDNEAGGSLRQPANPYIHKEGDKP